MILGPFRIMDFLGIGGPRSGAEVAEHFDMSDSLYRHHCEAGTDGWDWVCEAVRKDPGPQPERKKFGAKTQATWFYDTRRKQYVSAVYSSFPLPLDQPTPSHAAYVEQAKNRSKLREEQERQYSEWRARTVSLNQPAAFQLKKLPGIDTELALRIEAAASKKPFTSVDDLLTIQGMTREKLERIRPLVRVEP